MHRILIAQGSQELCLALSEMLGRRNQVFVCQDGECALQMLRESRPDALVLDLMLPGLDGLTLLQEAGEAVPQVVLATTLLINAYVRQASEQRGVGYVMLMPCRERAIADRLEEMLRLDAPARERGDRMRLAIQRCLRELGVSPGLDGYRQLCIGVQLFAQDETQPLCKELYPAIAQRCGAGDSRLVERSIRGAIRSAWQRRCESVWRAYFPPDAYGSIRRPTNKVFIARLAELAVEEMKQEQAQRQPVAAAASLEAEPLRLDGEG